MVGGSKSDHRMPVFFSTILLLFLSIAVSGQSVFFEGDEFKARSTVRGKLSLESESLNAELLIYGFEDFKTHLPPEFQQLEELMKLRDDLPNMESHYGPNLEQKQEQVQLAIDSLKQVIMDNRIRRSYSITCTFHYKHNKDHYEVNRIRFILDHAYEIRRMTADYTSILDAELAEWFLFAYRRYPLFNMNDLDRNQVASNEIYDFYEEELAMRADQRVFLQHYLRMVAGIRNNGVYDVNKLARKSVIHWWDERREDDVVLREVEFSELYQVEETDAYRIFVRYERDDRDAPIGLAIDLDAYLWITSVARLDGELDPYFERD